MEENRVTEQKITLGLATRDKVCTETLSSLWSSIDHLPYSTHLMIQKGGYIHENRQKIAEEAKRQGSSHLVFIDTDMWFPGTAIKQLIDHDKDIIGVNYFQREFPLVTTVKFADSNGDLIPGTVESKLFRCFSIGTGLAVIKMTVFDRIDQPWFETSTYRGQILGEDVWLCRQAWKKGIEVWCDPNIEVKHIGDYAY